LMIEKAKSVNAYQKSTLHITYQDVAKQSMIASCSNLKQFNAQT